MDGDGERVQLDCADEEIVARVAAIDVAKDSGMVCTRVPHPGSARRRTTTVWSVPARTSTIMVLAERLAVEGIERVVLESTLGYKSPWNPPHDHQPPPSPDSPISVRISTTRHLDHPA